MSRIIIALSFFFFGGSLKLQTRAGAVFLFVSFTSLLSTAGVPAHLKEIKVISNLIISYFFLGKRELINYILNLWWFNGSNLFLCLQVYTCEEANEHSGTFVFLIGQLLSSIPFLFLLSVSTSLVFYFLVGLRDDFSLLVYFTLNFFTCLLVNEGLVLLVASVCRNIFWSILTLITIHVSFDPTRLS